MSSNPSVPTSAISDTETSAATSTTSATNPTATESTESTPSPTDTASDTESTTTSEVPTTSEQTSTSTSTTESTAEPIETSQPTETSTTTTESTAPSTTTTTITTTTSDSTSTTTEDLTTSTPDVPSTTTTEIISGTTTTTITITDTSTPTTTTGDGGASSTIDASSGAVATETDSGDSGLSAGGTIAVAVVVPVVSVAILVLVGLWLWRRHKAKKVAEEERRKEVEEYGFNPNGDPTLPAVMGGGATDDNSGYRGWGTTSAGRKASTNLSSSAGVGLAMSEAGSQPGYHHAATPSDGTIQYSDGHGALGETEPYGILGAAPVATATNQRTTDINRGPSNASSAYSAGNHSEISEESHMSGNHPGGPYYDYSDTQQQYGGYSDPYGGQPVIRDVQARRNTQIQNPSVFPRQGNAGIAQNF